LKKYIQIDEEGIENLFVVSIIHDYHVEKKLTLKNIYHLFHQSKFQIKIG
jgi:hypothetical protein